MDFEGKVQTSRRGILLVMVLVDVWVDELHVKKSMVRDVKKIVDKKHERHRDDDTEGDLDSIKFPKNSVGIVTELQKMDEEERWPLTGQTTMA